MELYAQGVESNKKESVGCGDTIIEAQKNACELLGVTQSDVEFEIVQLPEKKKLGLFGGKQAMVVARIKDLTYDYAISYLKEILHSISDEVINIESNMTEKGLTLNLLGSGLEKLLQDNGEIVDAIQQLVSLAASQKHGSYYGVRIYAEGLAERRENKIKSTVEDAVQKVKRTHSKVILRHMNSYERRLVHQMVQDVKGISSWSEGEGRDRHIIIGLS